MGSSSDLKIKMSCLSVFRVVSYCLIVIFRLNCGPVSRSKMQAFLFGCHFFRQIVQFIKSVDVELHEISTELVDKLIAHHCCHDGNVGAGNLLICSSSFLGQTLSSPMWILSQGEANRWLPIIAVPFSGAGNKCFAGQQLLHNLAPKKLAEGEPLNVKLFPETICLSCSTFANTVHIAFVSSQSSGLSTASFQLDAFLKEYFSLPKYVQAGDLIEIEDGAAIFIEDVIGNISNKKNLGYMVQHDKTTFLQVTNKPMLKCAVRVKLKRCTSYSCFNSFHDIMKYQTPLQPGGLLEHCYRVESLIKPFLKHFIESSTPPPLIPPSFLISGHSGCGKKITIKSVAASLGLHWVQVSCFDLVSSGESGKAIELRIDNAFNNAQQQAPSVLYLNHIEVIGKARDGESVGDLRTCRYLVKRIRDIASHAAPVFVVGSCRKSASNCSADLCAALLHKINVEAPDHEARMAMLNWILEETDIVVAASAAGGADPMEQLVRQMHGFQFGDLNAFVSVATRYEAAKKQTGADQMILSTESVEHAIGVVREWRSRSMNAPQIPEVHWEDVGGLQPVISELLDTIQLPLKYPELVSSGLKRSGILLYGPPGTGKTLLAKAVATECNLHFLSVKGPELLNMYVGQSEENVRNVFQSARQASPCLIFFDELDSLAPNRGRSGDSGGVMDRVVSQLLAELDGINKSAVVFVIGATNRPDLIDPALLRPGRFDKLIYLGVNESRDNQLSVIKALTRRFPMDPFMDLQEVVNGLPQVLTGADLYSLCSNAYLCNVARNIQLIESGEKSTGNEHLICQNDFEEAVKRLVPSVSARDLKVYQDLKNKYECKN